MRASSSWVETAHALFHDNLYICIYIGYYSICDYLLFFATHSPLFLSLVLISPPIVFRTISLSLSLALSFFSFSLPRCTLDSAVKISPSEILEPFASGARRRCRCRRNLINYLTSAAKYLKPHYRRSWCSGNLAYEVLSISSCSRYAFNIQVCVIIYRDAVYIVIIDIEDHFESYVFLQPFNAQPRAVGGEVIIQSSCTVYRP